MPRFLLTILLFCAPLGLASAQTKTDDADKQRARTLFTEGGRLLQEKDYGGAEDRFRQALELYPHPPIAFNLAVTLEKQGRFLESVEVLNRGLASEFGALESAQRAQYEERISEMRRLLAELVVTTEGRATLFVDGREIGVLEPNQERRISLDPGSHLILAEFEQGKVERSLRLATSGKKGLKLVPPPTLGGPDGNAGQVDAPSEEADRPQDDSSTIFESPWFWAGTVAVIGGAVAAVLIVSQSSSGGLERDPVWGVSETLTGP